MVTSDIQDVIKRWWQKTGKAISLTDLAQVLAATLHEEIAYDDLEEMLDQMKQCGMVSEPEPHKYTP